MRKALLVVLLLSSAACASPRLVASHRIVATPLPTATATAAPTSTPAVTRATPAADGRGEPAPRTLLAAPGGGPAVFRGLGSWIDVFDHTDDPATVLPLVRNMARRGVQTLYLETARYTSTTDIQFPTALGAAVDEAKRLGMNVVAWYPPGFADLDRDVRRSLVAVRYVSPGGHHFDAFGADIEYTAALPDHAERTRRTVEYSRRLREGAGSSYPMSAIVIPPTALEYNPTRWPGFPWAEIKDAYDVFMPMNYWTGRGRNAATAAEQTRQNVDAIRSLTGRPVHIIGGLGADADEAQVAAYVASAIESGSLGGGLYDFATTRAEVWDELLVLRE